MKTNGPNSGNHQPGSRPSNGRPGPKRPEKDVKIYNGGDPGEHNSPSRRPPAGRKRRKKRSRGKVIALRVLKFSVVFILVLGIAGSVFAYNYVQGLAQELPGWTAADMGFDVTTTFYDQDGNLIAERHGGENRYPVRLSEVPDILIQAFLATEDTNFYDHPGISFSGIIRSAIVNIQRGRIAQGASTITQQLARNALLDEDVRYARSWDRKITEIMLALQLENQYTKDEILEMYLNTISFGQGSYGVQAASQTYFGKDVQDLTTVEAALLAGLPQRPSGYNPFRNPEAALARRSQVLGRMEAQGIITEAERVRLDRTPLELTEPQTRLDEGEEFIYFIDHVIDEAETILEDTGYSPDVYRNGYRIHTTMQSGLQKHLEELFRDPDNFPADMNDEKAQAAIVLLDHQTGAIQGLMGGREATGQRSFNRATSTSMRRQPGSATKPIFSYAPAIEYHGKGTGAVYDDMPFSIQTAQGPYTPRNIDGRYRGLITMREALRHSINIPAVLAMHETGVASAFDFALNLGLPLLPEERGNLALSLGGMQHGLNPLEMARAFGAFANQGVLVDSYAVARIEDRNGNTIYEANPQQKVAMSEETAYMVTDMMLSVVESGTGTRARVPGWPTAGKTGTSQLPRTTDAERRMFSGISGNRDAWFAGYTSRYTAAVWMGFDITNREQYLQNIYGGRLPALLFSKAMAPLHDGLEVSGFSAPSGVVSIAIDQKSGLLPSPLTPVNYIVRELFHRNHVPTEVSEAWEQVEICLESGLRATEYCPDRETRVFLVRPLPEELSVRPADYDLMAPTEYCTLHTEPPEPEQPEPTEPEPGNGNGGNDVDPGDPPPADSDDSITSSLNIRGTDTGPVIEWSLRPPWRNREFEFRIWRRSSTESDARLLDTTTDYSYQDVSVEPGNEYFYQIQAVEKESGTIYLFDTLRITY